MSNLNMEDNASSLTTEEKIIIFEHAMITGTNEIGPALNSFNGVMTTDEIAMLVESVRSHILPPLFDDPEENASRIAICMTMIDSTELAPKEREKIGLNRRFSPICPHAEPIFNVPWDEHQWVNNCDSSEGRLVVAHEHLERPGVYKTAFKLTYPFVLYQSLVGKKYGAFYAFATQSVEFINRRSIINGSWYYIRSHKVQKTIESLQGTLYRGGEFPETHEYFVDPTSRQGGLPLLMAEPEHVVLCPTRNFGVSARSMGQVYISEN